MVADRAIRADATGLALALGVAALLLGGVLQGLHLITGDAAPPPGTSSISTPTSPDKCAQVSNRCPRPQ